MNILLRLLGKDGDLDGQQILVGGQLLGARDGDPQLPVRLAVKLVRPDEARSGVLGRPKQDHVGGNAAP